jgi:hypothetical protein
MWKSRNRFRFQPTTAARAPMTPRQPAGRVRISQAPGPPSPRTTTVNTRFRAIRLTVLAIVAHHSSRAHGWLAPADLARATWPADANQPGVVKACEEGRRVAGQGRLGTAAGRAPARASHGGCPRPLRYPRRRARTSPPMPSTRRSSATSARRWTPCASCCGPVTHPPNSRASTRPPPPGAARRLPPLRARPRMDPPPLTRTSAGRPTAVTHSMFSVLSVK